MMGGNRNIAIFILLGMVFCRYHGRPQSAIFLLIILSGAIFSAAISAVAREYGIVNILLGNSTDFEFTEALRYAKRYNEGEFGTMFRVSRYIGEVESFSYYFPGFSYIFSPIINMIPSAIFPGRPDTIATVFSYAYAGAERTEIIVGLGFSPLAEAKINFGMMIGFPIFFSGVFIAFLSKLSFGPSRDKAIVRFFVIAVVAASLNYFRIDFALYVKFILITLIISFVAYKVCSVRFKGI
jgi:hypothetical protein